MPHSPLADIVCLLRHLTAALQPLAKTKQVSLCFVPDRQVWTVAHSPEEIVRELTPLICRIIAFIPEHQVVTIATRVTHEKGSQCFSISVKNTGINLSHTAEITAACKKSVGVQGRGSDETTFELQWLFPTEEAGPPSTAPEPPLPDASYTEKFLPAFYAEIRKRLQSYFTKSENLIAKLSIYHPKDASFLREVNVLIETNLGKEGFDVAQLSRAMNMSRVQLYRKLKPLIRQAPAEYIKMLRLQKARDLLETTDLRMGEIAFSTGFQSQSHFTKVFTDHYGMPPSLFSRKQKNVTKE
jgi:AraC-like DNA-binding protein